MVVASLCSAKLFRSPKRQRTRASMQNGAHGASPACELSVLDASFFSFNAPEKSGCNFGDEAFMQPHIPRIPDADN